MLILKTRREMENVKKTMIMMVALMATLGLMAQTGDTPRQEVVLQTGKGNIRIALYNETPRHRDNFVRLAREGYYDGQLFHRVISRFMIQAGDSASRHAKAGQMLGDSPENRKIDAEICYPKLFHKYGAVAAAREPDQMNPERKSSESQFYIVYGHRFSDNMLDDVQERLWRDTKGQVTLMPEVRQAYKTVGGTPHLDGQYTVFGEVVEGMDVVEAIQSVETDGNDRPLQDIRIVKATVVE